MLNINKTLDLFIKALNHNKRIICCKKIWYTETANSSTYSLLNYYNHKKEERRLLNIIQSFCSILDKLEKNLIFLEKNKSISFAKYVDTAEAITVYVNRYKITASITDALIQLKRRSTALYYRNLSSNEITLFEPLEDARQKLFVLAERWNILNHLLT